jgi:hypothetical protein
MNRAIAIFCFAAALVPLALRAQDAPPAAPAPQPAATQQIVVQRPGGVNISGPTTFCQGSETILKAEGDYESFEWNTGATDRFIRVREEGMYEVTVTTKGGCRLTTSVMVRAVPCT